MNSKGPKFPGNAPPISLEKYDPSTPTKYAWEKITNYSKEHIESILKSVEHQFEGLTQDSNLEMTEEEGREDWGGFEDDNNPTTPHDGYYETLKHATHEICNLLDNVHSTVSPDCAISIFAEHEKCMNATRDKCRAALREANTSLNIRNASSASVVHTIGGPPQKRTVTRTHNSKYGKRPRLK